MTQPASQIPGQRIDYSINGAKSAGHLYRNNAKFLYLIPYKGSMPKCTKDSKGQEAIFKLL